MNGERRGFGFEPCVCSKQTLSLNYFANFESLHFPQGLEPVVNHVAQRNDPVRCERRGVEGPSRDHLMVPQLCRGESLRCHGQWPTWRKKLPGRARGTEGWCVDRGWPESQFVFFGWCKLLQSLNNLIQLVMSWMIRVSTQIIHDYSWSPLNLLPLFLP